MRDKLNEHSPMQPSKSDPGSAPYDTIAPSYDEMLDRDQRDRNVRRQFHKLVRATVPDHAAVLDFGCGTGVDAQCYAQLGYCVLAYDVSSGMLAQLRERCAAEIRSGQIDVLEGPYPEYLHRTLSPRPAAVVANFAVLNLIEDLPPLFATFARQLEPGGLLIVSVLNPCCLADARHRVWWRSLPTLLVRRAVRVSGELGDTFRYSQAVLRRAGQPFFELREREAAWLRLPGRIRKRRRLVAALEHSPRAIRQWFALYHFLVFQKLP